jgi:hypothetical protein
VLLAKDIEHLVYEMILLSAKVYILRVVNKTLSKRYRAKKTRVYQERALIVKDTQDIIAQKDVNKQLQRDLYTEKSNRKERQLSR